ncbi:MAG TPA: hypothetical protein VGM62_05120 [Chthoniobacterales bacterium]|jgi:hypothetical protein
MPKKRYGLILVALAAVCGLTAQESPSPTISPEPTASPTATATPAPVRNVRVSFVPPPLEGTISLGIYDSTGKLVRVLHRQAPLDAFNIGADALVTKWDGKDDGGQDLPAGKYRAHGFLVGSVQIEHLPNDPTPSPSPAIQNKVVIKLMANPLVKNDRPNVELTVGFDHTNSFLKTMDDLPLHVLSERSDIVGITMAKNGEKSADVWQDSGVGSEHFRLSKLDQMMAFDCGSFDLK